MCVCVCGVCTVYDDPCRGEFKKKSAVDVSSARPPEEVAKDTSPTDPDSPMTLAKLAFVVLKSVRNGGAHWSEATPVPDVEEANALLALAYVASCPVRRRQAVRDANILVGVVCSVRCVQAAGCVWSLLVVELEARGCLVHGAGTFWRAHGGSYAIPTQRCATRLVCTSGVD